MSACPQCGDLKVIRIVNDLYRPDHDAPCPVCVGLPIASFHVSTDTTAESELLAFVESIAATDWDDAAMNLLVVNTLYPHGATAKQVRREGASAVRTLQAIVSRARKLTGGKIA